MTHGSAPLRGIGLAELVALEAEERALDRPSPELLALYARALEAGELPAALRERFERWRDGQVRTDPGTPEAFEAAFRRHLAEYPGDRP